MKRLYRFRSSRFVAKLFPIVIFAVALFAALELLFVQQAFAGATCRNNTTGARFCSSTSTCPSGSTKISTTCSTRTGGATGTGSDYSAVIKLGDENVVIIEPSVACGSGFIDATAGIAQGQAISCTFTPDGGSPQEAQCFFEDLECSCFRKGECSATGTRTSTMTCPTLDANKSNLAGCTGTVRIEALDGTPLTDVPIPIGQGLADLNTNGECGQAFPRELGLQRSVMGTITQECTSGSDVTSDLVLEQIVRSTNNYFSRTSWFDEFAATCNPADGFPANACNNDGGAWISFAAAESSEQCVAANFSCGQLANGESGPSPSVCRLSGGQCQCRCARCTPEGTLVNLGVGDQGKFVLANSNAAFSCPVTVTGN